ncbi:oleate hydratase [Methylocystis parvus]|uniref:Oleate hydratase n=1 Tax=Methylocystis parvus TaxID=134 RepID=A0A6B8M0K4_9HYPH|nr:oleate hydratase [Methylocystis parvus]QGM97294.1 oleate hydratase [Methylocystis parvus]WBJ98794.1 oleate hydratase [Methylocystis parvus OBBP]
MAMEPQFSDLAASQATYIQSERNIYLVGGGIASLAAAAFLIRDGDVRGHRITILEELDVIGGSLDGSGSAVEGYVLRGGRMLESKYVCTFDLFASIPTLDNERTVTQEIFDWNETIKTSSKSRLMHDGRRKTAPEFGLSENHILTIERLVLEPEAMLGAASIEDIFDPTFFKTNFWVMWRTTFAFQPWHSAIEFKRYLERFAHMVDGFDRLTGIMRTVYNQYDSLVRPLQKWLEDRGVVFELNAQVTDIAFYDQGDDTLITEISVVRSGSLEKLAIDASDWVFVTLGSMTEASSLGGMEAAPEIRGKKDGGAWTLWEKMAAGRPHFGRPSAFADHIEESKWESFTTTLHDPTFLRLVRDATGNTPGEGGLVTFPKSNWVLSFVVPFQPHFIDQPEGVSVFWGYGLCLDEPGNFVDKPMAACTGREIMIELLGHLNIGTEAAKILETANCIPCMMPFVTSQFLRRERGDRPQVVPNGAKNFAFIGQFCELPDDVVFTVEYSIRSAQAAVYTRLGLNREPPPVYKGKFDPRVLFAAFMALHDFHS